MRAFLDTSVLVAVFDGAHPRHLPSLRLFADCRLTNAACGAHTLAETYAVLTRLPHRPRVTGDQALLFVEEILQRLTVVSLDAAAYHSALTEAASRGILGGQTYDHLLVRCGEISGAATIYTWNVRHFQAVAPHLADRIRSPGD